MLKNLIPASICSFYLQYLECTSNICVVDSNVFSTENILLACQNGVQYGGFERNYFLNKV